MFYRAAAGSLCVLSQARSSSSIMAGDATLIHGWSMLEAKLSASLRLITLPLWRA